MTRNFEKTSYFLVIPAEAGIQCINLINNCQINVLVG